MTWPEAEAAVKEAKGIVIIPVGAIEGHGPHLPLNTDVVITVEPILRAATKVGVVVAPPVPWGNSRQNSYFAGTISIGIRTLIELIKDIARSLVQHGFDKIVIVNGHGGNIGPVSDAAEEIKDELGVFVCVVKGWELDTLPIPKGTPPYDGHGGSKETSLMLYLSPDDVDRSKFRRAKPKVKLSKFGAIWPPQIPGRSSPVQIILDAQETFELGHSGDPSLATRERGERIVEAWTKTLADFLRVLKGDEIRYMKRQRRGRKSPQSSRR